MDDNYNQNNGYVNPSDEVEVLNFNLNQEPASNQNAEQPNDKKRIIIIAAVVFIIILVILLIILSSSSSSVKKIDSKYFSSEYLETDVDYHFEGTDSKDNRTTKIEYDVMFNKNDYAIKYYVKKSVTYNTAFTEESYKEALKEIGGTACITDPDGCVEAGKDLGVTNLGWSTHADKINDRTVVFEAYNVASAGDTADIETQAEFIDGITVQGAKCTK